MKHFFTRSFLFAVPFVAYAAFLAAIDPYCLFGVSGLVPRSTKERISYKINYALWKTIDYSHNPSSGILLGNSRMGGLSSAEIESKTGMTFYNFSYGGGTLREIVNTFWFAAERCSLKHVCIGINFDLFNDHAKLDRVTGATKVARNPALYFTNYNVMKAGWLCFRERFWPSRLNLEKPPMDEDAFWQDQLGETTAKRYRQWRFPKAYHELTRISQACTQRGIRLIFVILPSHLDLQRRIDDFGLREQADDFKSKISALGTTYDFNFENEITIQRANFKDPYHFTGDVATRIIEEVWLGREGISRRLGDHSSGPFASSDKR